MNNPVTHPEAPGVTTQPQSVVSEPAANAAAKPAAPQGPTAPAADEKGPQDYPLMTAPEVKPEVVTLEPAVQKAAR